MYIRLLTGTCRRTIYRIFFYPPVLSPVRVVTTPSIFTGVFFCSTSWPERRFIRVGYLSVMDITIDFAYACNARYETPYLSMRNKPPYYDRAVTSFAKREQSHVIGVDVPRVAYTTIKCFTKKLLNAQPSPPWKMANYFARFSSIPHTFPLFLIIHPCLFCSLFVRKIRRVRALNIKFHKPARQVGNAWTNSSAVPSVFSSHSFLI